MDYAVCRKLGIPTHDIDQAVHRLLHLSRVQHVPDWLWSLIQSQAVRQWRECVSLDLEFMAAVLHDKLADLGDPRGQWQLSLLRCILPHSQACPCTILILAAKLARVVCCHLPVSLCSQMMKLPWRASKTGSTMQPPRPEVYGEMQVHGPVRAWEVGRGRKHNVCSGVLWSRFLCSCSRFHCNSVSRQGSCVSARASCLGCPCFVVVTHFHFVSSLPDGLVTCLCCPFSRRRRIPTRALVKTVPVLLDGFIGWVVLREARSQRFTWGWFFGLSQSFGAATTRVGLQGHSVNELCVGADPDTQRCIAPVYPRLVGWATPFGAVLPSGRFAALA